MKSLVKWYYTRIYLIYIVIETSCFVLQNLLTILEDDTWFQ